MGRNPQAREGTAVTSDHSAKMFPNTSMLHRPASSKTDQGNENVPHTACRWIPWLRYLKVLPFLWLLGNSIDRDCYPNSSFQLAQSFAAYPAASLISTPDPQ